MSQNQEFVVFLGFYGGFGGQELETTAKAKKNHQNSIWRDGLKMVVFFVFLSFCGGFGRLSWFLVVFLGFYGGFGGQELETTENGGFLMVFLGFCGGFGGLSWLVVLVVCRSFWWFFLVFTVVWWLVARNHCKKKNHEFLVLRIGLQIMFLLCCVLQDFRGQGMIVHCFSC